MFQSISLPLKNTFSLVQMRILKNVYNKMLVYLLLFLSVSANLHIEMKPKRSLKDLVHSIISEESSGLKSQSSLYNHQEVK